MAGLKEDKTPFISAFDLIGAPVITDDFVVGGTCTNNLYGMCESFYRPNMVRGMVSAGRSPATRLPETINSSTFHEHVTARVSSPFFVCCIQQ